MRTIATTLFVLLFLWLYQDTPLPTKNTQSRLLHRAASCNPQKRGDTK